jgi:hypothetical protein
MKFYFTKKTDRVPPGSDDRPLGEKAALVLDFKRRGEPKIIFTKGGVDQPVSTSSSSSDGVAIGPAEGGGIGVVWLPGQEIVVDKEADDWHLEGIEIAGGSVVEDGKDPVPLAPPVPTGANDAHGSIAQEKKGPEKSVKWFLGRLPAKTRRSG